MTVPPSTQPFPAARLADALECTPQAVRSRLASVPAQIVHDDGCEVQAWPLPALPDAMRAELQAKAQARGFRSAQDFLNHSRPAWQPKTPLSEVTPAYLAKAVKLRAAQAPALARLDDPKHNPVESQTAALVGSGTVWNLKS